MKYLLFAMLGLFAIEGVTAHTVQHVRFIQANNNDTTRPAVPKPPVADSTELSDSTLMAPDSTVHYSRGKSSSGGTVQVKGYYRKNGTYVKPYTRSAPKSHH
jgi:hypothetical protein